MRSLARKNLDLDEESEFERRDWWISLREEFEGGIEEEMGGETADSEIEKTQVNGDVEAGMHWYHEISIIIVLGDDVWQKCRELHGNLMIIN